MIEINYSEIIDKSIAVYRYTYYKIITYRSDIMIIQYYNSYINYFFSPNPTMYIIYICKLFLFIFYGNFSHWLLFDIAFYMILFNTIIF